MAKEMMPIVLKKIAKIWELVVSGAMSPNPLNERD